MEKTIEVGTIKAGFSQGAYFTATVVYKGEDISEQPVREVTTEVTKIDDTLPTGKYIVVRYGQDNVFRSTDEWFYVFQEERPEEQPTTGEQVLESFFKKWEAETVEWFAAKKAQYDEMGYEKFMNEIRPNISKSAFALIWSAGMDYIKEIVAKDMAAKKSALLAKVNKVVGDITELQLTSGADGTPNGYVTGTAGKVRIETIIAGGYNIQCVHYRVLVKKVA